jgi:hypothetical protein
MDGHRCPRLRAGGGPPGADSRADTRRRRLAWAQCPPDLVGSKGRERFIRERENRLARLGESVRRKKMGASMRDSCDWEKEGVVLGKKGEEHNLMP